MKNKMLYKGTMIAMSLCMLGISGCEKEVKSAVVEEKMEQKQDIVPDAGEENAASKDKAELLTVPQQVQAPETYTTSLEMEFTELDLGSGQGAQKGTAQVQVNVDASVEVPEVDAVYLKRMTRKSAADTEKMFQQWAEVLNGGKEVTDFTRKKLQKDNEGVEDGRVTYREAPYSYSFNYLEGQEETPYPYRNFYFDLDEDRLGIMEGGFYNEETGVELPDMDMQETDVQKAEAEELLEKLGAGDLRIFKEAQSLFEYGVGEGKEETKEIADFYYERMVDGVPVNVVLQSVYPVYKPDNSEEKGEQDMWLDEALNISYMSGRLKSVGYIAPVEVSDYSSEKLFLLPFKEVRQIFEDTVAGRVIGKEGSKSAPRLYPDMTSIGDANANIHVQITKVKLGYMRVRDEEDPEEGVLIPVWDFYGTWSMETEKDGEAMMDMEDVSLMTIDARDGTVIDRLCGC